MASRVILVVIFDERSSLGLVRLRVKRASAELAEVFAGLLAKMEQEKAKGAAWNTPPRSPKSRMTISTLCSGNPVLFTE